VNKGRPPTCETCGRKPRAQQRGRYCYDCLPGGPFIPPPCRRCGSSVDYYASGLCAKCHYFAPHPVDSCRFCHAWGAKSLYSYRCRPCLEWNAKYPLGVCDSCGQSRRVNPRGVCRLCWTQARRSRGRDNRVDLIGANRNGQQLYFADMHKALRRKGSHVTPPRPGPTLPEPVAHRQLLLFVMAHDLRHGYTIVRDPPDPILASALETLAQDEADRHGWSVSYKQQVRAGIRVLLGLQDTPGATIARSETAVLNQCNLPERAVCQVLEAARMLEDDRTPAIDTWFDRQVTGMPVAITDELRVWLRIMLDGSSIPPRRHPRQQDTVRLYLTYALPALRIWANDGHLSLREVSRVDIVAALPSSGAERTLVARGLRSIFSVLKARKQIFINPTARLRVPDAARGQPLPLDPAVIRAALNSADPARAAVTALIAFHGLSSAALRHLQLTDVRDGRLYIEDRVVLLAEPVRARLAAYLDYRRRRWPTTTNPHLFVNYRSVLGTAAVGNRWLWLTVDLPGGSQALRADRLLDEAHASGGDALRLSDLFGLSVQAATRYTDTVDHPDLTARGANEAATPADGRSGLVGRPDTRF